MKFLTGGKPREAVQTGRIGAIPMATVKSGWKSRYLFSVIRKPGGFYRGLFFVEAGGENHMKKFDVKTLAKIAILGALSFVLMMIEFPLPFIPPFYKLDFSEVAVLLGGFAIGWLPAVCIEALKIVLNLLFTGSSTSYVGEIANFCIGCAFCIPASLIYAHEKSRNNALKGLVIGTLCMCLAGLILNYAVLLPAYSYFYKMPMDALIGVGSALIPLITNRLTFVLFATTPFNLIKGILVGLVTFLLYKHVSPLLHK